MSALDPGDMDTGRSRLGAVARGAVLLAVVLAIAALIWRSFNDKAGVRREAPQLAVVALTPPTPPPPPPPPKEKPPEVEKTVETAAPTPKVESSPQKTDAAPKQLTINGPPQTSGPGLASGSGGGLTVGGDPNGTETPGGDFGAANYGRYLTGVLQRAAQADPALNREVFTAEVDVWIAPDGGVTRVALVRSSGDARMDDALITALRALRRFDQPPPAQLRFPAHIALHGRRA